MATKVHPQAPLSASSCYTSSRQETFTIWMKSLVLNGNGCTVFDSRGEIVYRVDNYNSKCRDEVYLMDFKGKVVFTILRKVKRSVTHTYEEFLVNHISCISCAEKVQTVQVLGGLQIQYERSEKPTRKAWLSSQGTATNFKRQDTMWGCWCGIGREWSWALPLSHTKYND